MLTSPEVEIKLNELMRLYGISCGPTGCQECADNKYNLILQLIEEYNSIYPGLKLRERIPRKCTYPYGIPE